ncbi:hypothetical protein Tco_1119674 [Tanacetum coccineum]
MSAMVNLTPLLTTVTKTANKEKASDAAPRVNIEDFCEEHYEDILPIIMEKARQDKRKEVQTRLNFGESSKKPRREKESSLNSKAENSSARIYLEKSKAHGHETRDNRNVFSRLSHRRKSVHERLSDTYFPSTTRSGPRRSESRDPSRSRGRPLSRGYSHMEDRLQSTEERDSESPSFRGSESGSSNRGHWKSKTKRRKRTEEDDLVVPWTCEDVDPFTPKIPNFKSSQRTRIPNNVKTYDGTGDPEDHLKIFQAAAQVERWAMPTWCHMFNSTLIGAARKKYVKDPVEIHNIKQKDEETIEEFMKRFKIETGHMKGAPECMRISGFMHGVNNPESTNRLNKQVPKTMDEMMTVTTAFIRGEAAAASKKKGHAPWKSQDQPKRHASD